jgi:hypothetical protein
VAPFVFTLVFVLILSHDFDVAQMLGVAPDFSILRSLGRKTNGPKVLGLGRRLKR